MADKENWMQKVKGYFKFLTGVALFGGKTYLKVKYGIDIDEVHKTKESLGGK